jgi:glutamine synthetase
VRLVRFLYCGLDGVVRGRACHVDFLGPALRSGVAINAGLLAVTGSDRPVLEGPLGLEGTLYLVPDLSTFSLVPYAAGTAQVYCELVTAAGTAFEACPRTCLRRMLARAAQAGFTFRASFESEFFLLRPDGEREVPFDRSPALSARAMDAAASAMGAVVAALDEQGARIEHCGPEVGHSQHELSVRFDDALRAADVQLVVRETTRAVAARHGLLASFAPKPVADEMGNGSHIHASLWSARGRANRFHAAGEPLHLSNVARWFIGGLLEHLPALLALTAPAATSFQRLVPRLSAGSYRAWGSDNRETAIRVPTWPAAAARRSANVEFRPCDALCNPHLALAGVLAAGLDGIARRRRAGPPLAVDPNSLSDAELEHRGVSLLPASLADALDHLEGNAVLLAGLGPALLRAYVALKRSELWDADAGPVATER